MAKKTTESKGPDPRVLEVLTPDLVAGVIAGEIALEGTAEQLEAERLSAEIAEQEEAKLAAADNEMIHYLLCRHCQKPGVFFKRHPGLRPMGNNDWFASYKPATMQWPSTRIPCQSCNMPLDFLSGSGQISPNPRFVRSISKAELKAKQATK